MLFFRFIGAWLATGWAKLRGYEVLAGAEVMEHRFQQCQPCKYFQDGTCTVCGCLVYAKIMLAMEKCPKKRWQRVWRRHVTIKR